MAEAKKIFRPHYRLYAGAFVDVAFDYFVANDQDLFPTEESLSQFVELAYNSLREHELHIPPTALGYFTRMQQQNWLYNYRFVWGIQKSFGGIVYRSKYLTDSETAAILFEENFFRLRECYNLFIPDLKEMVNQQSAI
ncbi:MAG: acyl carrier protein phosphodiesterase [Chitinophagaceae bacterium]|nr:acyl carrier protein phosphodiesterase [Chitinophagaceae bacterium]